MSEFRGTPGPWSINTAADYCGTRIDGPDGRGVAHAIQRDAHPVHGQGITQAEAEANGRLIAAAPELLDLLRTANQQSHTVMWQAKARDVIAKATGSQP